MNKEVYIHGGYLKTGSTFIQNNLYKNKNLLLDRYGIDFWGKNSSVILRSIFSEDPYNFRGNIIQNRLTPLEIDNFNNQNIASITKSLQKEDTKKFLISAESISSYSKPELQNLVKFFSKYDSKYIFFIRNPVDYLNSVSQELVKQGMQLDYLSQFPPFANYNRKITEFFNVFGRENTILLRYDYSTDVISVLLDSLNVQFEKELDYSFDNARESLSEKGIIFLDEYNFFFPRIIEDKPNPERKFNINMLYSYASKFMGEKFSLIINKNNKDHVYSNILNDINWLSSQGIDFTDNLSKLRFSNKPYEKYLKPSKIILEANRKLNSHEK